MTDEKIVNAYLKAVAKGMLKVMAKMGISTLQSYKGRRSSKPSVSRDEVIDRCFSGTASRIQGVDFERPRQGSCFAGTKSAIRRDPK